MFSCMHTCLLCTKFYLLCSHLWRIQSNNNSASVIELMALIKWIVCDRQRGAKARSVHKRLSFVCDSKLSVILIQYFDYEIRPTRTVTKATNAGNLKSVHWGNLYLNIFKGLAKELSGFLISIFIVSWSTGDVPEACGS